MSRLNRRTIILGMPSLVLGVSPNQADAFIQGLLIRAAGRAVGGFFSKTGVRRSASSIARRSANRGLKRMESSGFKKHREEFTGGIAHGTGSAVGEAITTKVISAIRPNKQNGIVYCAAVGTDCNTKTSCQLHQRRNPALGDSAVTGGFQSLDKQIVLFEEANAIGLDWVASKKSSQGWTKSQIAATYFPVGYEKREIGRTGKIREQSLSYLTPSGKVTTEEKINYANGSGHVKLSAYADGKRFDDYFTFTT